MHYKLSDEETGVDVTIVMVKKHQVTAIFSIHTRTHTHTHT
jgi:hypothetical protein